MSADANVTQTAGAGAVPAVGGVSVGIPEGGGNG